MRFLDWSLCFLISFIGEISARMTSWSGPGKMTGGMWRSENIFFSNSQMIGPSQIDMSSIGRVWKMKPIHFRL